MRTALETRSFPCRANVADDLTTAGGVAHEYGVLEIKRFDHGCKIVGIAVHVIAGKGLTRPAMATTVVRDHTVPVLRKEKHLALPSIGVQRATVRERYDGAFAPILVVDFGAVLGGGRASTHSMNFSISVKRDLPIVVLPKLWIISIQRKRSVSQYIKGPQRNWSLYDQRDRWSTYRIISADMILLVQGFGQSYLLLDIQVTTFHILLN